MKKKELEKSIVSARIWLHDEVAKLAGFAHEQFGLKGIDYSIKEMKRLRKKP
jgi:hypothetical protein